MSWFYLYLAVVIAVFLNKWERDDDLMQTASIAFLSLIWPLTLLPMLNKED